MLLPMLETTGKNIQKYLLVFVINTEILKDTLIFSPSVV